MLTIMLCMLPPQRETSHLQMNFAGLQELLPAGLLSSVPPEQPMVLLSSLQLAVVHIVFMTGRSFTDVDAH